ncbi:MAG TPA: rhomboid family intramembrane serine protease [Solirubrobacteraceae bacterium]|nr:rhomboid family intramembrane serine protease [Solirubrobacteraceae bacterium]
MTSGADLFVVCKQCGSEVSPYITECPYCGHRLRRRAPKLPRAHVPARASRGRRLRLASALRMPQVRSRRATGGGPSWGAGRWAASRPYATIALVAAGAGAWIASHAEPLIYLHMAIIGPLGGEWWKLLTSELAYASGPYAFVALVAIGIFGWLIERRHGPAVLVALFFGAGATGALAASALYSEPIVGGGNGAALALLAAWVAPDLKAARSDWNYEGDLLGAGAIAALLLAIPFALQSSEASWLAGVTGGALGLLVGLGLSQVGVAEG